MTPTQAHFAIGGLRFIADVNNIKFLGSTVGNFHSCFPEKCFLDVHVSIVVPKIHVVKTR
jgi:hypothetical protein